MPAFFSIIIPTYNRAHLLSETIHSVLNQEYENYELIIVDDGSKDNTKEVVDLIINKFQNKAISYIYQDNQERAAARNNGLKHSKGDYIIYFDSDDTLYPHHLKTVNQYLEKNTDAEFMHFRYDIKNSTGQKTSEGPVYSSSPNTNLILGNFLSCNGVVIKREIALANLFNETRALSAMEDWELWLRLATRYPIHYINTITSTIINHDDRSVLVTNKLSLVARVTTLMDLVLSNKEVATFYKKELNQFKCSCYSYISLHLALTKQNRNDTIRYLSKSLLAYPLFFFQKRFFAIIKHLI